MVIIDPTGGQKALISLNMKKAIASEHTKNSGLSLFPPMLTTHEIEDLMGHYLDLISKAKLQGDEAQRRVYEYQLRLLEVGYKKRFSRYDDS